MLKIQVVFLSLLLVAGLTTLSACTRSHVGQSEVREEPEQGVEQREYERDVEGHSVTPEQGRNMEREQERTSERVYPE